MWFQAKDLIKHTIIPVEELHGYVLSHAGTSVTGGILSHTLRFRPTQPIKKVVILYYPASEKPDIDDTYFHEYYVPWQAMVTIFDDPTIQYEGYNIGEKDMPNAVGPNAVGPNAGALVVVSADFSHYMDFHVALELENKAARALMFKEVEEKGEDSVVDSMKTFKILYDLIPAEWQLQWVGRERSPGVGADAVGYLTFLLMAKDKAKARANKDKARADGMFITVYSKDMVARECQGKWFKAEKWSAASERNLLSEVIKLGETTSRLTGGTDLEKPLTHYAITYLYRDQQNDFIRGWHGVLHNAFYLPDVFLENTFNNGKWITARDNSWPTERTFKMAETLQKLNAKAGRAGGGGRRHIMIKRRTRRIKTCKFKKRIRHRYSKNLKNGGGVELYSSRVAHYRI